MEKTYCPIYVVDYTIQNYLVDDDCISRELYFADYFNAVHFARDLSKCEDIIGSIKILNSATGEILFETEANDSSFVDRFGYTWKRQGYGLWSLDCTDRKCSDCIYNQNAGDCKTDYLTLEEITKRIGEVE